MKNKFTTPAHFRHLLIAGLVCYSKAGNNMDVCKTYFTVTPTFSAVI